MLRFAFALAVAAAPRQLKLPAKASTYVSQADLQLGKDAAELKAEVCSDTEALTADDRQEALESFQDYSARGPQDHFVNAFEVGMEPATQEEIDAGNAKSMDRFNDALDTGNAASWAGTDNLGGLASPIIMMFLCCCCYSCCCWTACPCCGCCLRCKCCMQRKEPKTYMRVTKLAVLGVLGFLMFLVFTAFIQGQVGAAKLPSALERTECTGFQLVDTAISGTDTKTKNFAGILSLLQQVEEMLDMLTASGTGGPIDRIRDLLDLTAPVEQTVAGLSAMTSALGLTVGDTRNIEPGFEHKFMLGDILADPLNAVGPTLDDTFAVALAEARSTADEALSEDKLADLRNDIEKDSLESLETAKKDMRTTFYDLRADYKGEESSEDSASAGAMDAWKGLKMGVDYANTAAQCLLAWSFIVPLCILPMIYSLITHEKKEAQEGVNPYPTSRFAACGWCCGCCYIMFAFFIAGIFQSIMWPLAFGCQYAIALDETSLTDAMTLAGVGDRAKIIEGEHTEESVKFAETGQNTIDVLNTCFFGDGDIAGSPLMSEAETFCFSGAVPKKHPPASEWQPTGDVDSDFTVTDPDTGDVHMCEKRNVRKGLRDFIVDKLRGEIDPAFDELDEKAAELADQTDQVDLRPVTVLEELLAIPPGNLYFALDVEALMANKDYVAMTFDKRGDPCASFLAAQPMDVQALEACVMNTDSLLRGFFVSAGCGNFDMTPVKNSVSDYDLSMVPDMIYGNNYFRDSIKTYPGVALSGECGDTPSLSGLECAADDESMLRACLVEGSGKLADYCSLQLCQFAAPGADCKEKSPACPAVAAANLARLKEEGLKKTYYCYPMYDPESDPAAMDRCATQDSDTIAYDCVKSTPEGPQYRIGQQPYADRKGEAVPCSFEEYVELYTFYSKQLGKGVTAMFDEAGALGPKISGELRQIIDEEFLPPIENILAPNNLNCAFVGEIVTSMTDAICVELVGGMTSLTAGILFSAVWTLLLTLLVFFLWRHFVDNRMAWDAQKAAGTLKSASPQA